jgi:hypothetical protein
LRNIGGALKRRLTYANVAATVALVVAMGGTAYAAAAIGSAEIIDNSIQSADVKNGALTSLDVKNETLQGVDVKDGSMTAADLAAGSVGSSELADGAVELADLAASARSVDVQPFAVVIPASFEFFAPRVVLGGDGSFGLTGTCVGGYGGYALVEGNYAESWAVARGATGPFATYDHSTDYSDFVDFTVIPGSPQRGWVVLANEDQQRAMLVYLGVSVALDGSQCAFDGFAIDLR